VAGCKYAAVTSTWRILGPFLPRFRVCLVK
jgi:hypothetical protein